MSTSTDTDITVELDDGQTKTVTKNHYLHIFGSGKCKRIIPGLTGPQEVNTLAHKWNLIWVDKQGIPG